MENRIYYIQEISDLLNIKYATIRTKIDRELKKQKCLLTLKDKIFIITKANQKLCLVPVEAEPVNIDEVENKTCVKILEKLLPCLCTNCSDAVKRIKEVYEGI